MNSGVGSRVTGKNVFEYPHFIPDRKTSGTLRNHIDDFAFQHTSECLDQFFNREGVP